MFYAARSRRQALPDMKLQLGTSRLDKLPPAALEYFLRPGWVHFGDSAAEAPSLAKARQLLKDYGPVNFGKICLTVLRRKLARRQAGAPSTPPDLASAEVKPFYYNKGDALPFADGEVDFIYAEHFMEHLFLDEAIALLRETHRILAPGGVVRIASPDADLRTDHPLEPAGFPYVKMPFTHPEKHKTRWSVYSLCEAMRLAGLRPLPLRYHDKEGKFHDLPPASLRAEYPPDLREEEYVLTLNYLRRARSLIVDGIREA